MPKNPTSSRNTPVRPAVTAAITRATFREWARVGYASLAMEAVARRAGVGKAALYRRWPSKEALVADLMRQVGTPLGEVPDHGSKAVHSRTRSASWPGAPPGLSITYICLKASA